jgi:hypothetical protein
MPSSLTLQTVMAPRPRLPSPQPSRGKGKESGKGLARFGWSRSSKGKERSTTPELAPPQPGIRVSSLAPLPRGPGSLQRSLSSPASLRSVSTRQEAASGSYPSLDCVVGPSRALEAARPEEGIEGLTTPPSGQPSSYYSSADYWAALSGAEDESPCSSPLMVTSMSGSTFLTAPEEDEDDLEIHVDPYATLIGLGVALDDIAAAEPSGPRSPELPTIDLHQSVQRVVAAGALAFRPSVQLPANTQTRPASITRSRRPR